MELNMCKSVYGELVGFKSNVNIEIEMRRIVKLYIEIERNHVPQWMKQQNNTINDSRVHKLPTQQILFKVSGKAKTSVSLISWPKRAKVGRFLFDFCDI